MTIHELIQSAGTTFFGVEFVKSNGTLRHMVCQSRGTKNGLARVFVPRVGYRSFWPEKVFRITVRGQTIERRAALKHIVRHE